MKQRSTWTEWNRDTVWKCPWVTEGETSYKPTKRCISIAYHFHCVLFITIIACHFFTWICLLILNLFVYLVFSSVYRHVREFVFKFYSVAPWNIAVDGFCTIYIFTIIIIIFPEIKCVHVCDVLNRDKMGTGNCCKQEVHTQEGEWALIAGICKHGYM